MEHQSLISLLESYGLSTKESQIYLAGLKVASAPVSTIARLAGVHRVVTYDVLKVLVKKGYCKELKKGNTVYYTVLSPEQLAELAQHKLSQFQQAIPEFLALQFLARKSLRVSYFEGIDGIKRQYDDILTSKTDVYGFFGADNIDPIMKEYLYGEYIKKRVKAGVYGKGIAPKSAKNIEIHAKDSKSLRDMVLIDQTMLDMDCEIIMYDESKVSIALLASDELAGIIIDSPRLYKNLLSVFNLLWNAYSDKM